MSQRVKLAKTMTCPPSAVWVKRTNGDRINAGDYHGRIIGNKAIVAASNYEFEVLLPEFFRRPMTCQVLIAPTGATVIPRPTITEAFGLLCKSLIITPEIDSESWSVIATIKRANDGEVKVYAHGETARDALERVVTESYRHAVDWFDADPLSPDPSPDDHLEVPSDGFEPMRVDLMKPFPMEIPQVVAEEPDPTSDVQ